ncbi:MAG: hypothetical protein IKX44_02700 [Prevotella sp.]|nr:hypothetical protein [Prevotella sp.]
MQLPAEFINRTRQLLGSERFERYLQAFEEETPVSIRLNPAKTAGLGVADGERVPWCRDGYYLTSRPNFTFDPLLHAGCYYVQEASSMFLDEVLRQWLPKDAASPLLALDLCAAPGGKSTLLRSALPEGSTLFSNEPNPKRASILAENIAKWGWSNCFVTNNYPREYRKSKLLFDVILCDVPCSGEGMFRKDAATIGEWSPENVEKCWQLQRDIVSDAWECLREGGLMIYSTCTLNTQENEENILWMQQELGAEVLPVVTQADWHITGSLLPGFSSPVYRFIPGFTRGEGLFMAVVKRPTPLPLPKGGKKGKGHNMANKLKIPNTLKIVSTPLPRREGQGGESVGGESVPLSYPQAIAFLRREALVLPADTPRGIVAVSYEGHVLGLVKNIGNRANNLYPKEWRIKSTYIPETPPQILISKQ